MSGGGGNGERPGRGRPGGRPWRPQRPAASTYSGVVGLVFLAVIAYAIFNAIATDEGGVLGADAAARGWPLPEFAVPDVRTDLVGDANVFQDDCESGANPCPPEDVRVPACRISEPRAIRICDLFDRPLVLSFWFTRGGDCLPSQDAFDRVARRFRGRVNFLSINVRDERERVREIIAERGWRVPVGWDRDGAVSNLYRVGVCPTVAFVYPGGILHEARIGTDAVSDAELTRGVRELIAASRQRVAAGP